MFMIHFMHKLDTCTRNKSTNFEIDLPVNPGTVAGINMGAVNILEIYLFCCKYSKS